MIVADRKPLDEILESIKDYKKIMLMGCGGCVTICFSGGTKAVELLASQIRIVREKKGDPIEVVECTPERQCEFEFIDALKKRGCRFSLDDFGAGLSSFAYLKSFNVDVLKIDGSFIRDITDNRISESMVAAITQVAKVMELETVAEYVESKETKKLITELGVDFAQGHAVGKPIALDQVLAELTEAEKTTA